PEDVGVGGEHVVGVHPGDAPGGGVVQAAVVVRLGLGGVRPGRVAVAGGDVEGLPARAAVGRAVGEAEVGDDDVVGVGAGHGEAEGRLAVAPAAVAVVARPAGGDVLVGGGLEDARPVLAAVGGLV